MRRRHHRSHTRGVRAAALGLLAASVLFTSAASADETDLGAIGFGSVVVDNVRDHVLVSGPSANVVDVLSYSGEPIATIVGVYGARGMVIKGHTLFVAESMAGAIVEINLKTLTLDKVPLATGLHNPRWLAIAGGELWVTTGSGYGWGGLASVNLMSHAVRQFEEDAY